MRHSNETLNGDIKHDTFKRMTLKGYTKMRHPRETLKEDIKRNTFKVDTNMETLT